MGRGGFNCPIAFPRPELKVQMRGRTIACFALTLTAAALLAACGGSQQVSQTPPQAQGGAASTLLPGGALSHGASRQLPRYPKRSHGLLYVTDNYPNAINIFPLKGPNQKQIGTITDGVNGPWGLSVDSNKSLYVANQYSGNVTVYAYGTTIPSMVYSGMT